MENDIKWWPGTYWAIRIEIKVPRSWRIKFYIPLFCDSLDIYTAPVRLGPRCSVAQVNIITRQRSVPPIAVLTADKCVVQVYVIGRT